MSKTINQKDYIQNGQFSGGEMLSGSFGEFGYTAGGLYIGTQGDLVATTVDGTPLVFKNISGFVPGLFTAISGSTTAADIIALK
jgi:hypothetical protein